jgi:TRAP-type C4-dicarboxylate transport system permease small subunit
MRLSILFGWGAFALIHNNTFMKFNFSTGIAIGYLIGAITIPVAVLLCYGIGDLINNYQQKDKSSIHCASGISNR